MLRGLVRFDECIIAPMGKYQFSSMLFGHTLPSILHVINDLTFSAQISKSSSDPFHSACSAMSHLDNLFCTGSSYQSTARHMSLTVAL
jgi:hypothetical protein